MRALIAECPLVAALKHVGARFQLVTFTAQRHDRHALLLALTEPRLRHVSCYSSGAASSDINSRCMNARAAAGPPQKSMLKVL